MERKIEAENWEEQYKRKVVSPEEAAFSLQAKFAFMCFAALTVASART